MNPHRHISQHVSSCFGDESSEFPKQPPLLGHDQKIIELLLDSVKSNHVPMKRRPNRNNKVPCVENFVSYFLQKFDNVF